MNFNNLTVHSLEVHKNCKEIFVTILLSRYYGLSTGQYTILPEGKGNHCNIIVKT